MILRVIFAFDLCMYSANLVYACYIPIAHFKNLGKEDRSRFFILFYMLVITVCACEVASLIKIEFDPHRSFSNDFEIFGRLSRCFMLALGWQVTATMFQLTMSIREVFNEVSQRKAKY